MYRMIALLLVLLTGDAVAQTVYSDPTAPARGLNVSAVDGEGDANNEDESRNTGIRLQALVIGKSKSFAMINGEKYYEGEEIQGMKIAKIEAGKISLRIDNEMKEYYLFSAPIASSEVK